MNALRPPRARPGGTLAPTRQRTRLPADVRSAQVLDAALAEFSARGFNATRMDDIAARAGLSKGGLYAHFASKDEIFETLLDRTLVPSTLDFVRLADDAIDARTLIGRFVDRLYEDALAPTVIATLRLLIVESVRAPRVIALWQRHAVSAYTEPTRQMFERAVARGLCRHSVVVSNPWLAISPTVHVVMMRLVFGDREPGAVGIAGSLAQLRDQHVELLCELLDARAGQL